MSSALQYKVIPVTPFQQNCSLIWCSQSKKAAVVDPGGDVAHIMSAIEQAGVTVEKILLTHGHLDHVGGTRELAQQLNVPVVGPQQEDSFWLESIADQCQMFGFPPAESFTPEQWLNHGDTVTVGEARLQVLHTPGHTPGHVVFFSAADQLAWVGDVLFAGSIGRSDFPRGDHNTLIDSIRQLLLPLGDEVEFIPGHGPNSTFGREKRNNPFL